MATAMAGAATTAIRGTWVLATEQGEPQLVRDRWVVVEGATIAAVTKDKPAGADRLIDRPDSLVLPGFINLHNHGISALLFRGIIEDRTTASWASSIVYGLIMPLQGLAVDALAPTELRAVTELGLLGLIKSGTTTLMDNFRLGQAVTFEVAEEMGLRLYGMPYVFSTSELGVDQDGTPNYVSKQGEGSDLDRCIALFHTHDGAADGRIRVGFGPHGVDTCDPELLRAIRKAADELGCPVTIHLSQSEPEHAIMEARYGKTPAEYLQHVGLLGPDLLTAHCVYASDADLDLLRRSDTTIVNCPMSFARGGVNASFDRFTSRGIRTVLGTDGYAMDFIAEMRAAAIVSKQREHRSEVATAWDLTRAATLGGAAALGRRDLGRIEPGARADLVVIDMAKPHIQPVSDPIKTLVWHASGGDVHAVVIDGQVVVEGGQFLNGDEGRIVQEGAAAIRKIWRLGTEAGFIEPGEVI